MTAKAAGKWARAVLTAVGVLIFVYLIHRIGLHTLRSNLVRFGPWFLLTCLIAATWLFSQAVAWWLIQKAFFTRLRLGVLFRIKIISDTFNLILPSASLGGDAMRAFLIRENVPLKDGIPSVLFDKTIEFCGSILFLVGGFLLGLTSLRLPRSLTIPVSISLGMTAIVIILLVLAQKKGLTTTLRRLGRAIPKAQSWIAKREGHIEAMDRNFRLLYTRSNTKAIAPLAIHFLSRFLAAAEVLVIMAVLKAPVSVVQAIFITTVVTAGNTVFFVLPGQWGVTEGLHVLVLQSLGYPAAVGLSLAVVRRIRKLVMASLGLAFFAAEKRKPPRKEAS
jgi:uncharacterized membrane protein YbhN (UPF0104 family)